MGLTLEHVLHQLRDLLLEEYPPSPNNLDLQLRFTLGSCTLCLVTQKYHAIWGRNKVTIPNDLNPVINGFYKLRSSQGHPYQLTPYFPLRSLLTWPTYPR